MPAIKLMSAKLVQKPKLMQKPRVNKFLGKQKNDVIMLGEKTQPKSYM